MRTLFTAMVSALAILAGTTNAATIKAVWNQPLDSPANVAAGARVTTAPGCLRETNFVGTCFTDHDPADEEEPAA